MSSSFAHLHSEGASYLIRKYVTENKMMPVVPVQYALRPLIPRNRFEFHISVTANKEAFPYIDKTESHNTDLRTIQVLREPDVGHKPHPLVDFKVVPKVTPLKVCLQ